MLERAGATGKLEAGAREGRATIAIREGRVIAVDAPLVAAPRLGRVLVQAGIERDAIERVASEQHGVKLGDAVVRAGLVGQGAVSHAIRLQLRARVRAIARWPAIELRFEHSVEPRAHAHAMPVRVGELMLGAMREAIALHDASDVRAKLDSGPLVLTSVGLRLIDGAPLWPDEHAASALLRRGTTCAALERAGAATPRALRFVLALRWLDGAAPPPASASVALLARKVREVRRGTSAHALLDVPRGASPEETRRAWKRLAGSLHPDRFQSGGPDAISRASEEVASAINGAARRLRATR